MYHRFWPTVKLSAGWSEDHDVVFVLYWGRTTCAVIVMREGIFVLFVFSVWLLSESSSRLWQFSMILACIQELYTFTPEIIQLCIDLWWISKRYWGKASLLPSGLRCACIARFITFNIHFHCHIINPDLGPAHQKYTHISTNHCYMLYSIFKKKAPPVLPNVQPHFFLLDKTVLSWSHGVPALCCLSKISSFTLYFFLTENCTTFDNLPVPNFHPFTNRKYQR